MRIYERVTKANKTGLIFAKRVVVPTKEEYYKRMKDSFTCIAHRGASGYEPENSMRSFRKAIDLGARWIECDARVVEGHAILFHDRTLSRLTGQSGVVASQSLAYINSLSLSKGEKIPLLSDVLSELRGTACLQVELKGANSGLVVALELLKAIDRGWLAHDFLVSSFDYEELMTFKQTAPNIPLGLLTYGFPLRCLELAKQFGAQTVHMHHDSVSQARVRSLQAVGLKVFVYTVNEPDDISIMRALGVDGIFSDFPDRALRGC